MKTLNVDLGSRSYPIYIGQNLLNNSQLIKPHVHGKQVFIVSNETIAPLYLEQTKQLFAQYECDTFVLPDGEEHKTMANVLLIIDSLMQRNFDRRVTLVALGGGVIGDMTGFAASIYRRGVNFIQIPTTLLAQVDSSVGGKTGVNHVLGKNMIGTFYQPQCVIADTNTLNTLEDRQLSSGIAEVIKYALINDEAFLSWLEQNIALLLERKSASLIYAIEQSCEAKAKIVASDEKEAGVRALLNLGHTFGHAIETALGYGFCLHGEAIAIGMLMAADLSVRQGWLSESARLRMVDIFKQAKLPTLIPASISREKMLKLMLGDKKVLDGQLHLVLFKAQAQSFITAQYDQNKLIATIDAFIKKD